MPEGAIYKAIPAIMAEIGSISKDRTNEAQRYKFRGIDDVYNAIHPLLIKHKVFTVPEILEEKDSEVETAKGTRLFYARLKIKYTFFAEDGSFITAVVRGEGMDSGDKASNKAMAVAHKYALIQTFAIPTEDGSDPENESHEVKASDNGLAAARAEANKAGLACRESKQFTDDEISAMRKDKDRFWNDVVPLQTLAAKWKDELLLRVNTVVPFGDKK